MFNLVALQGHLTEDPRHDTLPSGTPVCNLSLTSTEHDPDVAPGRHRTMTIRITLYGQLARMNDRLARGDLVTVHGRLRANNYTDSQGIRRREFLIVANECHLLPGTAAPTQTDARTV